MSAGKKGILVGPNTEQGSARIQSSLHFLGSKTHAPECLLKKRKICRQARRFSLKNSRLKATL